MENNYSVYFHPNAEKEPLDSLGWYELSKKDLGIEFMTEINKVLDLIELNPLLFSIKRKLFREAVVKKFPYLIIYKIDFTSKKINILSIFNTNRNPRLKYSPK